MNIGIDVSRAFTKEKTGIEEYSYQLIKNLTTMDLKSHQIFLYARKNPVIDFDLPSNFKLKVISLNKLWTQIGLASEMMKNKPDILFVPSYTVPQIHPTKTVVTIHGLEYKYFPECYSLKERLFLELNTKFSIKWSSKIIVPSENTKRDLMKFYKVDGDKIKVIHHGARSQKFIKSKVHKVKNNEFNVLFIGRLEKRKNVVNLIKAFELFKKSFKNPPNPLFQRGNRTPPLVKGAGGIKLTLAGKTGFGFEEIKKAIQESLYKKDIILKDYVSEEEKDKLYKSANLFALPSFYEGFGLPVLEAMNYGVPVICSDTSSLPEVAGDAALLVDPNNIQEIADAMNKVFSDNDLRNKMIEKGLENVEKFSWEKCARETVDVLLN
ncbi:glycosyltransferase family 4 protein [Candidatus Parcubacteria bacterium]|nr:glycosyltransferase family 4 protein [Candidatus Parcubacteria bacterium]